MDGLVSKLGGFMKKLLILAGLAVVLSGCAHVGYLGNESGEVSPSADVETAKMMMDKGPSEDKMMKKVDEKMTDAMREMVYQYTGVLTDVTGGDAVGGVSTGGLAAGTANSTFDEDKYSLYVMFSNLPDPNGTDFYEGWVVRKQPLDVVSTGRVEKVDGEYSNMYSSGEDLTDHRFYVLTVEPDDDDPAPAGHILEGTMEVVATL